MRKVFAKSFVNNSAIPAQRVLTADGAGGTYWAIPSTLGLNPSFNQINTSAGNFTADLSYNIFTLTAQTGIGFSEGAGSNELNIYGKAFNQIDVSGNNSLYGFTNNRVTPVVKLAAAGGITLLSDPDTNTVTITAQGTQISSSLFSFQQVQVYRNASTVFDNLSNTNSVILNAASPSSVLKYVGLSEILLSTNATNNVIFYTLNSNTGTISSILGTYVGKTDFSTATTALASTSLGYYNILSTITINGLSTLSTAIGNPVVNLSTVNLSTTNVFTSTINFNDITNGSLNALAVSSGVLVLNGQGIVGTAGNSGVSEANLISTVVGLGTAGYVSTLSTNQLSTGWLKSGIVQLSTLTFKDTGNTNQYTLYSSNASLYFNDAPVGGGTVINNSNYSTYVYQVSSVSTLVAYANFVNISSVTNAFLSPDFFSSIFFSTGNLNVSSVSFRDTTLNTTQYLTVNNGILKLNTSNILSDSNLVSSVVGLGTAGYISSLTLISTVEKGLASTVRGLGTSGYISSSQLGSTVAGLAAAGFVSTGQLVSSIVGLGTYGYISSSQLGSTVVGLGAAGFVSTGQLVSTVVGLGTAGYLSSSQLASTVAGLGNAGYISSLTLISTVENGLVSTVVGLGTAGYISSLSTFFLSTGWLKAGTAEVSTVNLKDLQSGTLYALNSSNATLYFNGSAVGAGGGGITTANLTSTVTGLGSSGYISSTQLTSTISGLNKVAVTRIIAGTNITISPTTGVGDVTIDAAGGGGGGGTSFAAFSTVLISTVAPTLVPKSVKLEYIGVSSVNGIIPGPNIPYTLTTGNRYSQMSTVQFKIDQFSSFIRSSANLYIGLQYSYLFSYWETPAYIDGSTMDDAAPFVKPYVSFSTALMLGRTPGAYNYDVYTPSIGNKSNAISWTNYGGLATAYLTTCNSYTANSLLKVPNTSFQNLYTSTFSLYHVLGFGLVSPGDYNGSIGPFGFFSGTSGFSSPDVSVSIGSNNPITLYVTN